MAGFDDIPIPLYSSPPLTSVRVPINAVAAHAIERLGQWLSSDRRRRRSCEILETLLVVRRSCVAARADEWWHDGRGDAPRGLGAAAFSHFRRFAS